MNFCRLSVVTAFCAFCTSPSQAQNDEFPVSPFLGQPEASDLIYPGQVVLTFRSDDHLSAGLEAFSVAAGTTHGLGEIPVARQIGRRSALVSLRAPFSLRGHSLSQEDLYNSTWQAVQNYLDSGIFESVEPVYVARSARTPNDPEFSRMWHFHSRHSNPGGANFTGAWKISTGSRDIRVAVIDTGILEEEPEFATSSNLLYSEGVDLISDPWMANDGDKGMSGDGIDYDTDPHDPGDGVPALQCGLWQWYDIPDSWHGSHVSGTVGAVESDDGEGIAGTAWEVSVVPIRVLGRCGGTTVDIAEAIRWAAGMQVIGVDRTLDPPADIINLSLGGRRPCTDVSGTIQAAINDAVERGALVVAAAGNDQDDTSNFFPASCDNVITVAASDATGQFAERYSNFGERVDIMAPGGDMTKDMTNDGEPDGVLSIVKDTHQFYNGTSMAAPHVSGALALLLSHRDDIRAISGAEKYLTVRELLFDSAVPGSSQDCTNPCGAGLLDAGALLGE